MPSSRPFPASSRPVRAALRLISDGPVAILWLPGRVPVGRRPRALHERHGSPAVRAGPWPPEADMGLLGFLGLGGKGDRHLVVITFEGPGRLRLNGNRSAGKRAKQGA